VNGVGPELKPDPLELALGAETKVECAALVMLITLFVKYMVLNMP